MKINEKDKFYPDANEWMWNYCTFLGKYTDKSGNNYDLGILIKADNNLLLNEYSLAIVYDNIPGSYISSYIPDESNSPEFVKETLKRARNLNLIKK